MPSADLHRWTSLMEALGFPPNRDTFDALLKAYSEKHRAYHTLDHINACLGHLDETAALAANLYHIELALWFHDAVYKPFSKTNEDDSAAWAAEWLKINHAPSAQVSHISGLILTTKDHNALDDIDAKLMLDIDLSILGASWQVFEQYEKNIRFEYKRVPYFIYRKARQEILQGFLNRPNIYFTVYFREQLEANARTNLTRSLEEQQT